MCMCACVYVCLQMNISECMLFVHVLGVPGIRIVCVFVSVRACVHVRH